MPAVPLESRLLQALAPWREAGGWCVEKKKKENKKK